MTPGRIDLKIVTDRLAIVDGESLPATSRLCARMAAR